MVETSPINLFATANSHLQQNGLTPLATRDIHLPRRQRRLNYSNSPTAGRALEVAIPKGQALLAMAPPDQPMMAAVEAAFLCCLFLIRIAFRQTFERGQNNVG